MLKGSVYLVTGGNSGLGKATVELLLSEGAKVAVFDLKISGVSNENLLQIVGDVASEEDMKRAVQKIKAQFGKLHGVVNCAGIFLTVPFETKEPPSLDVFRKIFEVNTIGTFNAIRLAVPLISENVPNQDGERGVMIMTSSVTGFDHGTPIAPGISAYAASKAAVAGMTMHLAKDLADRGIRVVSIAPGAFRTPMLDERFYDIALNNIFPKRLGDPREFAKIVKTIIETPLLNATTVRLDAGFK